MSTTTYTIGDLNKMNKADILVAAKKLLDLHNTLQEKVNNDIIDSDVPTNEPMMEILTSMKSEISEINNRVKTLLEENSKLKATIEVSRNVTNLLKTKITALETQQNKTDQYSRRECLEISGIPRDIDNDDLESKSLEIFKSIGVNLSPEKIHACHRIGRKGETTIIKLVNRKDVQLILANKKKLKDTDKTRLGFENGTKVFINESLCPYYKGLWTKAKKLLKHELIQSFWTSNGTVKVRSIGEDKAVPVFHDEFYSVNFPEFDFNVSY